MTAAFRLRSGFHPDALGLGKPSLRLATKSDKNRQPLYFGGQKSTRFTQEFGYGPTGEPVAWRGGEPSDSAACPKGIALSLAPRGAIAYGGNLRSNNSWHGAGFTAKIHPDLEFYE